MHGNGEMVTRRDFLKLSFLLPVFAKTQFVNTENAIAKNEQYTFFTNGKVGMADTSPSQTLHISSQYPIQFPITFSQSQEDVPEKPIKKQLVENPQPARPTFVGHFLPGRNK